MENCRVEIMKNSIFEITKNKHAEYHYHAVTYSRGASCIIQY